MSTRERVRVTGVVRQASNDCAANKFGRWLPDCNHSADDFIGEQRKNSPQIDANAQHDPWLGGALIRRRTRKLAAILASDVVGYSRLMRADEAGTLAVLKRHRETVFDPAVVANNGRIVKLIGDSTIVEFGSVVDAVG